MQYEWFAGSFVFIFTMLNEVVVTVFFEMGKVGAV